MDRASDSTFDRSDAQVSNVTGYRLVASNVGQATVFANANDIPVKDSNLNNTTNINTTKLTLHVLYQCVAQNAILNDGGRADDAKCLPGTCEEVVDLIEKWADDPESNRILWLTGPAGAGKTAIMKTVTERAANRDARTIDFFFSRGDSTRQSIQPVIPTLLYQFFEYYPHSVEVVADIISTRPRIFDESIAQQCKLISALSPIIRQSSPPGTPTILLVDGLDECDVDADRSQGDILRALEGLLMEDDSPFRLLVASRPEARTKMAFNQLSLHAQTIFLDEQYLPEQDIERFVVAEFDKIKSCHPSAHLLPSNWPLPSDIEGIVKKSSGQLIFAATVMRYIAHPSTVPSLSLERVKGIVPTAKNSPFMHLDSIYIFILSRVDDLDAVLAMFSLAITRPSSLMQWLCQYNSRYTFALVQSCVSELSAIVELTQHDSLTLYHASFRDFVVDKARSGKYWIDVDAFRAKMLVEIWNKPTLSEGDHYLPYDLLCSLNASTTETTHALIESPLPDWITCDELRTRSGRVSLALLARFIDEIERLYYNRDAETYRKILFQCLPHWAQCMAGSVDFNYLMSSPPPISPKHSYDGYLKFLSTGGVTEWASTVGNSNVVQHSITSILYESAICKPQKPDHPGAQYLRKRAEASNTKNEMTPELIRKLVGARLTTSGEWMT